MPNFFIQTFGCRCNQADSAALREGFHIHSLSECQSPSDADLIIVNTCTVTRRSDRQVRQAIRSLNRKNPEAKIIVTGCYAEREPEILSTLPGVAMVVGNAERDRLPEMLPRIGTAEQARIVRSPLEDLADCPVLPMAQTGGKTRPLVKLQDGCDARCAYCIVPKVRGPGRSAQPADILKEIRSLIDQGFQEIVLTGVHLGTYGRKWENRMRLPDLLKKIVALKGLGRIRLSSIEPMFFDRAIVGLAASSPVFAHHFHIPLQSGSDRILRRMRRPYRASRFSELVRYIHKTIPDAAIGTDLITGFPGESDRDFADTRDLVQELPLAYMHVFPFSPREGTEAYSFPDRFPPGTVKQRLAELLEISREKNFAFRRQFIGQALPAITLSREEERGGPMALTGNYIHAKVPVHSIAPNRLVDICIDKVTPESTLAHIIAKPQK